MRLPLRYLCLASLALCVGTASPPPLQVLEYNFSVDYQTVGEAHASGIRLGTGVVSQDSGTGRQGKMTLHVQSRGDDGSVLVDVSEWLQDQPRARQAATCTIRADGGVGCAQEPQIVTDAELVLLQALAPGLHAGAAPLHRVYELDPSRMQQWKIDATYTADAKNTAALDVRADERQLTGRQQHWLDQGTFVYGATLPKDIHYVSEQAPQGNAYTQATIDLHLTSS